MTTAGEGTPEAEPEPSPAHDEDPLAFEVSPPSPGPGAASLPAEAQHPPPGKTPEPDPTPAADPTPEPDPTPAADPTPSPDRLPASDPAPLPDGLPSADPVAPPARPALAFPGPPPILDVPGGVGRGFLHVLTAIALSAVAFAVAVNVANHSLGRMTDWASGVVFAGFIALVVQAIAGFPTLLASHPPSKVLVVSSALPFTIAALAAAIVFPQAIGRGGAVSAMEAYPAFVSIAALMSGTAFLASAIVVRASLVKLLALPGHPVLADESAEARGLLAAFASVGAAALLTALMLVLHLRLRSTFAYFVFATLLGAPLARQHGRAAGAVAVLAPSPLRDRLGPRIALLPVLYGAAVFLLGLAAAMTVRATMLAALLGQGGGVSGPAGIDRALLLFPWALAFVASSSFWLPALLLPSVVPSVVPSVEPEASSSVRPPIVPAPGGRSVRIALGVAFVSTALLLRMEDAYERRVGATREGRVERETRADEP